jgi:hypothetical protein
MSFENDDRNRTNAVEELKPQVSISR